MKRTALFVLPLVMSSLLSSGCLRRADEGLTSGEVAQAAEELETASASQAMVAQTVEITTNFTIGEAVQTAAQKLRDFYASQWACADVQLSQSTLTVTYGANGSCPFNRYQSITGTHQVTVAKNDAGEVVVDHVWTNLSNGVVELDGTAHVTWNLDDPSRHVEHDLTWTKLTNHKTWHGTGNRVQRPYDGDIRIGFTESGDRAWTDASDRDWSLVIDDLRMRWQDPVPESGSLTLDTPFDKTVTVTFSRVDSNTIHIEFEAPRGSIGINVSSP